MVQKVKSKTINPIYIRAFSYQLHAELATLLHPHTKKSPISKVAIKEWASALDEFRHNSKDGSFAKK